MDAMQISLIEALLISGVTAGVGTVGTIAALRVHIMYLREAIRRVESSVTRAHERIDKLESGN